MRSYHALYNPSPRARRSKANPSSSRARRPSRARSPRTGYPKLRAYLKKNPTDTVEEAVQLVKEFESKSSPDDSKISRMVEMRKLSPLKFLLIKPGDVVEAMGETWAGDDSNWSWVAFDTSGNAFERGEARTAVLAMREARSKIYAAADPAIRAFAAQMMNSTAFGSSDDDKARDRALAEGFELQTFVPEGYETPLPGNFADRPVPGMPGYVIRVYASWDAPGPNDPGNFGDRLYYFQVLDPNGQPVGSAGEAKPKYGRVDIPDDALVAALKEYTPNPSRVKADSDRGIIGPFPTSMEANQAADLVASIFAGGRDVAISNPAQRRKLVSVARRGAAKRNPELFGAKQVWGATKKGAKGLGNIFGADTGELVTKEGGVTEEEIDSLEQQMGLPSSDPAATFRMGYYWGILRGIKSCGITDIFKRKAFERQFQKKVIEAYNDMAQEAIKKGGRVRKVY